MSSAGHEPVAKQYRPAAKVPLIKSPSLWLPKPVEIPTDIHPLPEDITAYFVYPFALEPHVLSMNPQPHQQIAQTRQQHAQYLAERREADAKREKDKLNRMAPGYDPKSFLVPLSSSHKPTTTPTPAVMTPAPVPQKNQNALDEMVQHLSAPQGSKQEQGSLDPMDALSRQFEELERRI